MIKRLARWILKDEVFNEAYADALCERFCQLESTQYDDRKILHRHESQMGLLREQMKILQTRQVGLLNRMERL